MSFSSNMINTARTLLSSKGESISFTRVTEGAYNPATSAVASGTTTNYTADGLPTQFSKNEIDGDLIQSSDIRLILEKPSTETPAIGDTCVINSITYRVQDVTPIRAEGTDIFYIAQLRK